MSLAETDDNAFAVALEDEKPGFQHPLLCSSSYRPNKLITSPIQKTMNHPDKAVEIY